jgi:DNA-binding transcriptional regulator GbsR (MarR family)
MDNSIAAAQENFIQGLSRISQFWGFPRAMGAIFGALYLSPDPLCLDELVAQVNVTKGAVSTNVRALERLGLVHRQVRIGERRDYYTAETDFWKIIKGLLREREKSEFDHALCTVDESLQMLKEASVDEAQAERVAFYVGRLKNMQGFFRALDNIVATLLALDEMRMKSLERIFGIRQNE